MEAVHFATIPCEANTLKAIFFRKICCWNNSIVYARFEVFRSTFVSGRLTGCAGARLHNLVKPAQFLKIRTIPQNSEKFVEIVIKEGISIDHHDF